LADYRLLGKLKLKTKIFQGCKMQYCSVDINVDYVEAGSVVIHANGSRGVVVGSPAIINRWNYTDWIVKWHFGVFDGTTTITNSRDFKLHRK